MNLRLVIVVGCLVAGAPASAGQAPPPPLFVTSVAPDANAGTLTISGGNFGRRPFVTLDLIPLEVRASTDGLILAVAPIDQIPAGDYLLTVSRGPALVENASLQVTLGGADAAKSDAAKKAARADAGSLPSLPPGTAPAALVGDRTISIEDVDREWRRTDPSGYLRAIRELYDARVRVANSLIADELLAREAAARGVTVDALLAEEVPKRIIAMPDSAVISLYVNLGANTRGASLDQMRPALRAWLERHSEPELAKMNFIEELKKVSTKGEILLDAPRVRIDQNAQDVALGPQTAAVEIVAFGDLQSAEYARFAQVFPRIRETFGERVRFVFKSLPAHGPPSIAAAEAALCANAQDKFWTYHDAVVGSLGIKIIESAGPAGLNTSAFNGCVERREFRDAVRKGIEEADRYGIQASPSFLVNGRLAPPPPPFLAAYDYFKLLIEEELAGLAPGRRR